jgi:hypothetical protein
MFTNIERGSTVCRPGVVAALLGTALFAGCFTDPTSDVGKMVCATDDNCPSGYVCKVPGVVGGCQKPGGLVPDGGLTPGLDGPGPSIDGPPAGVDGPGPTIDGPPAGVDQGTPIDSVVDSPVDSPVDRAPDADAPPISADTADGVVPDKPVPTDAPAGEDGDGPITLVRDTAIEDTADVGGIVRNDAAPDLPVFLDAPAVGPTPNSLSLAAGGTTCSSVSYKAILTLGQSPGGNTVLQSTSYRLVGGLVGATQ